MKLLPGSIVVCKQKPVLLFGNSYTDTIPGDYNSERMPLRVADFEPLEAHPKLGFETSKLVYKYYSNESGWTGADPEIFAFDTDGQVVPAWKWLPSNAEAKKNGYSAYWDGPQAEFTVPIAHCHEIMTDNVRKQLLYLRNAALKGTILKPADVVKLPKEVLLGSEAEFLKFGCAPSSNAYNIKPLEIGDCREHKYRYAGSHFHHSMTNPANIIVPWFPEGTIVMMDKIAGLLLTALFRDLEDPRRRKAYGRPGEYRVPNAAQLHLEYRTPSAWCLYSPEVYNFAADICRFAYRMGLYQDGRSFPLPDVKEIILNCDADAAVKVIEEYAGGFTQIFDTIYPPYEKNASSIFGLLKHGLKSFEGAVTPIAETWGFDKEYKQYNNSHTQGWLGYVKRFA